MEARDCINTRRSIRKYLQKPVEFDKVTAILEAATKAPSAGNTQDYRFIVITDKDLIGKIAEHCTEQYWITTAPLIIVVCADLEKAKAHYGIRGERLYTTQNAAAAIQNMLLTAHNLELGSCWVGSFDEDYVNDLLGIPGHARPQAIIPIGYPDEEPREKEEKPIEDMVFFNSYGNKIENMHFVTQEYNKEISKMLKKTEPAVQSGLEKLKTEAEKLFDKARDKVKKK